MKIFTQFLVAALCLAMLLTACAPAATTEPTQAAEEIGEISTPPVSGEKVTINIWGFEGETEFFPRLIEAFEA